MKRLSWGFVGAVSVALLGCSGTDTEGGSTIEIEREKLPESRYLPAELEDAVNDLIVAVEKESAPKDDLAFGVVLKNLANFWRPVVVGANRALAELEVIGSVEAPPEEGLTVEESQNEQIKLVEKQVDFEADGLVIAPHNTNLLDVMDEFSADGAPIVTIDSDLPESDRAIFIGTEAKQAGKTGGETLIEFLDGTTGRVILLGADDPSWVDGYNRTNEAKKVIEAAGNDVVVLNSVWIPEDEVEQVVAELEDGGPPVGMLGVFANAHALATAALQLELEEMPTIVAFDFEQATLDYMDDGIISATHVQRQYYMGYMSVYTLFAIQVLGVDATKEILGDLLLNDFHLDTGLDVIKADNLDEYNDFIDDLGI